MQNLAGHPESTRLAKSELEEAGIPVVALDAPYGEPRAWVGGAIGEFTFRRAWYYWIVNGPMPLAQAEEMYVHADGRHDVRVAGHCGCPPPSEWADEVDGQMVVDCYHVDTAAGLALIAATIKSISETRATLAVA
jgi:hypothetical protein